MQLQGQSAGAARVQMEKTQPPRGTLLSTSNGAPLKLAEKSFGSAPSLASQKPMRRFCPATSENC